MAASAILVNLVLVTLFYKEPYREKVNSSFNDSIKKFFLSLLGIIKNWKLWLSFAIAIAVGKIFHLLSLSIIAFVVPYVLFQTGSFQDKMRHIFGKTVFESLINIWTAVKDMRLLLFLIIMIGFWTMFNQLFYTLPNFIDQWVNTRVLYDSLADISPALAAAIGTKEGTIAPEMLVNLDAGAIIFFQVLISTLVMKFRPINGIISGIIVNAVGIGIAFGTGNGFYLILGIFIFAIGEMASSPKFTEYIGRIAPKNKEALYMGTSFLPVAAGNFFTGFLSGDLYEAWSDKVSLLKLEVAKRGLEIPEISSSFSQNDYYHRAGELMGMDQQQLTDFLWNNYNPSKIWIVFSAIGLATIIGLVLYDKFILGGKEHTDDNEEKAEVTE
jgi:hypothetical protein